MQTNHAAAFDGVLLKRTPSEGLRRIVRCAAGEGTQDTSVDVLLADLASGHVAATTAAGQLMDLLTGSLGTECAVKWRALAATCLETLAELIANGNTSFDLHPSSRTTSWRASKLHRPSLGAAAVPVPTAAAALEHSSSGNNLPSLARIASFESIADGEQGDSKNLLLPEVNIIVPTEDLGRTPPVGMSPVAHANRATIGDEEIDGSFTINQHLVLMPIGRGSQGEVFLAMDTTRNKLRAVKAIRRPKGVRTDAEGAPCDRLQQGGAMAAARHGRRQQLEKEIAVMKRCRHRNLVALHEVIDDPQLDVMYLVMQYVENGPIARVSAGGTIEKTIPPAKLAEYGSQIVSGLQYLHRKGVIHRDIKPDNVLIGSNDDVYLADFGTSELFECNSVNIRVRGTRGTLAFMAPELFADHAEDDCTHGGPAVDVWALGVTFYVLLYGKLPWTSKTSAALCEEILSSSVVLPPQLTPTLSDSAPNTPARRTKTYVASSPGIDPLPEFFDFSLCSPESQHNTPYITPFAVPNSGSSTSAFSARRRLPNSGRRATADFLPTATIPVVVPVEDMWASLIGGMLHRDPSRRLTLQEVATQLHNIKSGCFEVSQNLAASFLEVGADPISVVRRPSQTQV